MTRKYKEPTKKLKEINNKDLEKDAKKHPFYSEIVDKIVDLFDDDISEMDKMSKRSYLRGFSTVDRESSLSRYIRLKISESIS